MAINQSGDPQDQEERSKEVSQEEQDMKILTSTADLVINDVEIGGLNTSNESLNDYENGDLIARINTCHSEFVSDVSISYCIGGIGMEPEIRPFTLELTKEQAILLGQFLMLASNVKTDD